MHAAQGLLAVIALLAQGVSATAVPADTRQLLVVTTGGWDATSGTLTRWERAPGQAWRRVGGEVAVLVGTAGLAWGRGLHPARPEGRHQGRRSRRRR